MIGRRIAGMTAALGAFAAHRHTGESMSRTRYGAGIQSPALGGVTPPLHAIPMQTGRQS